MAVCQYFLRGQCRFGDSCKNEHPKDGQRQGGFGNPSWKPRASGSASQPETNLLFSIDSMTKDLTPGMDKPMWPLTSYGPAKNEPTLITGFDESPEELRYRAVTASKTGQISEYLKYESEKISAADQTYANARASINQVFEQASKQSLRSQTSPLAAAASTSAFGNARQTTSVFGQPAFGQSAFSQTPSSGGSISAFGNPSAQPTSAFGNLSAQPTSAFGQPSAFGQTPSSSIIKPATGAFASLGSSSGGTSAFGNGGGFSAFAGAQPATFGNASNASASTSSAPQSVFGQPFTITPSAAPISAFGNPAPTSISAFGNTAPASVSAFGAPAASVSAFGAPAASVSAFGTPAASVSAFGTSAPAASVSAFGTPAPAAPVSAFGTPAFGAPSAFGALSQASNTTSAFAPNPNSGGSVFGPGGTASGGAFGTNTTNQQLSAFASQPSQSQTQASSPFAPSQNQNQNPSGSAFAPAPGSISAFSQSPSQLQPPPATTTATTSSAPDFLNAKSPSKLVLTQYDNLLPENYANLLPEVALKAFQGKTFEWGKVPEWIPPIHMR